MIAAAAAATGRIAGYTDVVYDGVLGPWFLEVFSAALRREALHYAVLLPPLHVCVERVRTRHGHGFTDRDAAAHLWREFDTSDIDRRHVLRDPQPRPVDVALSIREGMELGTMRYP